jgi:hypothetical protein
MKNKTTEKSDREANLINYRAACNSDSVNHETI